MRRCRPRDMVSTEITATNHTTDLKTRWKPRSKQRPESTSMEDDQRARFRRISRRESVLEAGAKEAEGSRYGSVSLGWRSSWSVDLLASGMAKNRRETTHSSHSSAPYSRTKKQHTPGKSVDGSQDNNAKEWEEAICPVCMEHPHNAVLLTCSSGKYGCRPYVCNTGPHHSNCLQSLFSGGTTTGGKPTRVLSIKCPFCRGHVSGWQVADAPAREYMNSKRRECSFSNCNFSGNYADLRVHVRSEHSLLSLREDDNHPTKQQRWERLVQEREMLDAQASLPLELYWESSTVRLTMLPAQLPTVQSRMASGPLKESDDDDDDHEKKVGEWEEAICPMCMEPPHNAVLMQCSSLDRGCRPFVCNTGGCRPSDCLGKFNESLNPSTLTSERPNSVCPLCRGEIRGLQIIEPARAYMNSRTRSCSYENCEFSGDYAQLSEHVRSDHRHVEQQPRETAPDHRTIVLALASPLVQHATLGRLFPRFTLNLSGVRGGGQSALLTASSSLSLHSSRITDSNRRPNLRSLHIAVQPLFPMADSNREGITNLFDWIADGRLLGRYQGLPSLRRIIEAEDQPPQTEEDQEESRMSRSC
ncbi:hypothetical protein SAY87_014841 [Trapa incisa]|uniref:Uncharacterized protein n=1 Tax=Trapa incisa TaxID=236973 RepID=A0AAN7JLF9_9MYRT|nr:hypothetical protein SAY87_014841 [Trapa incisa]